MTTPRNSKLSPAKLRAAFKQDIAAAWAFFCGKHPNHTPYAFALYGTEGAVGFSAHVLTEESLTMVAKKYLDEGYHDTLDEARSALRYSVPDSPLFDELQGHLPTVDAIVGPHAETIDETAGYALLAKAAMAALKELDGEGLFGTGTDREPLLLVIITEDTEEEWAEPSARRLNPKSVFQRFEEETRIEGTYTRCIALAVSSDGRSLYMTGSREKEGKNLDPNEHSDSEVVAFDLQGPRLVRRWTFLFPSFGDSGRQLVCEPEGRSVVLLRQKYTEGACRSLLMRFTADDNKPHEQCSLAGEPASFAMSADGSRFAVAMHDKSLHVLDREFRVLQSGTLEVKPCGTRFVRSDRLLVAAGRSLLCVSPLTCTVETSIPLASFRLVADEDEKLLAVSELPPLDCKDEIGVHLLSLPDLKPIRTILIPRHQAGDVTALSPDGRLLAFKAREIGKHKEFVAVFNTATGQEVGRKKASYTYINDLAFLRDNRTLAIADSRFTESEAIDLWTVSSL